MSDRSRQARLAVAASILLAALLASLSGCSTVRPVMARPGGFAEYRDESVYRAVSPEGVVLRVRLEENRPTQTLEFWAEALRTQLEGSGYSRVGEESVDTPTGKAVLLEWAAPVGQEDWIYLTGIALHGSRIAVIEAAGAYPQYTKRRAAILESLRTLEVRQERR